MIIKILIFPCSLLFQFYIYFHFKKSWSEAYLVFTSSTQLRKGKVYVFADIYHLETNQPQGWSIHNGHCWSQSWWLQYQIYVIFENNNFKI